MWGLLVLVLFTESSTAYGGYDTGEGTNSCGRPYRAGRMHKPPCNLATEGGYCKDAGENYPWHAVRRFVKENRGLMRRMYGEQPESAILREELARMSPENVKDRFPRHQQPLDLENELYREDEEEDYEDILHGGAYYKEEYELKFEGRYMRDDDVLRTKFIFSEEPTISIKLAGLKTAPMFRQATTAASTTVANEATIGTTSSTSGTTANLPNGGTTEDPSQGLENSTVASSREADESVESTTDLEEDTTATQDVEKTKATSTPSFTQVTTERTENVDVSTRTSIGSKPRPTQGVLFQDMEEAASEKVKVNFKMAGVNACPVKEEVVAPFWANNTRGEVLALLNMYPFEQYVHWEKCSFENKQMYCREGCRCEQQYRLHRLLAYDPQNECKGIFSDWFRFPSCCVCKCYGLPSEFRVTSRSPRNKESEWVDTGTVAD